MAEIVHSVVFKDGEWCTEATFHEDVFSDKTAQEKTDEFFELILPRHRKTVCKDGITRFDDSAETLPAETNTGMNVDGLSMLETLLEEAVQESEGLGQHLPAQSDSESGYVSPSSSSRCKFSCMPYKMKTTFFFFFSLSLSVSLCLSLSPVSYTHLTLPTKLSV